MKRGEIWTAGFPAPDKLRPVVLVSRDEAYETRELVTVANVTTRDRGLDTQVPVGPREGLSQPSVINCDLLHTIRKSLLRRRIAELNEAKVAELDEALSFALSLD